jgi:threonine synthase
MTTVRAPNVHDLAIEGSFDDAQAHVKRMFNDADVTTTLNLGAVNSINWARLMAQVVYYFASALQLGAPDRKAAFSVPTGNFGDVFAGYVAAKMGLPIERLIVATNVNDILHRALSAGDYSASGVTATITPSMDIQVSSNFERLLFDGGGRDGTAMAAQMHAFEATKAMHLTNAQAQAAAALFTSALADQTDTARAMQWAYRAAGQVMEAYQPRAPVRMRVVRLPNNGGPGVARGAGRSGSACNHRGPARLRRWTSPECRQGPLPPPR